MYIPKSAAFVCGGFIFNERVYVLRTYKSAAAAAAGKGVAIATYFFFPGKKKQKAK